MTTERYELQLTISLVDGRDESYTFVWAYPWEQSIAGMRVFLSGLVMSLIGPNRLLSMTYGDRVVMYNRDNVAKIVVWSTPAHIATNELPNDSRAIAGNNLLGLRAYPNNPAALRAIRAQAK